MSIKFQIHTAWIRRLAEKIPAKQGGQSLVELLMAVALASVFLPALLTGLVASKEGKAQQTQRLAAVALLKEAQESVRVVREKDWTSFAVNGTYHPATSSGTWVLQNGAETINGFSRQIAISDTLRDSNGSIVSTGGAVDPSTKKVDISVSWTTPIASSVQTTEYLSRYLSNITYTQTTQADFNAGIKTAVTVTNTSGGEVQLGAGGGGDWCSPNLSITALDLPKNGVANALTAIQGQAFAGTGDNSSGVSFANISISNTKPPVASISGTFDGYKTNDVFGETNYAYLATDNNGKEIEIITIANPPYSEAGYFNAPGNTSGESVFVSGSIGYMTANNNLYTFDLSSKSGSRPQLGSVTLSGGGTKVWVVGSYAYVSSDTSPQLQIIQVSNGGRTLSVVGQASVSGSGGKSVFINSTGTRAYLVTGASSTQKEFFIVDTSTKTGNRPTIGSYETNGMDPKGVTVVPGNRAIVVGSAGEQYQVVDITNESAPTRCGGLTNPNGASGINAVSSVIESDGDAYSYILTNNSSKEFQIIEGGPGGQFATSGTFESSTFFATPSAAFNRFFATMTIPPQTSLNFQFAGADINSQTGICNTFNYVGPDATSTTYYATTSATLALNTQGNGYLNPARCFRYKAFFNTSDMTQSPVLYDMNINYSP